MGKHKHGRDKKEGNGFKDGDYTSLLLIFSMIAGFVIVASLFIPNWRYDSIGMTPLKEAWNIVDDFQTRSYGLISVTGSFRQTWTTLVHAACDFRNFQAVSSAVQFVASGIGVGEHCGSGVEQCQLAFLNHMDQRCREYEVIARVSSVTMAFTFFSFVAIVAGTMLGSLSNRERTGGVVFGLYLGAALFSLISNMTWAIVTNASFKKLGQTAWYPYPSLHVSWYLHLFGALAVLVCDIIWGFLVMPTVCAYDPAANKLKKHMKKMDRMKYAVGMGPPTHEPYWQEHLNIAAPQNQGQQQYVAQLHDAGDPGWKGKGQGKGQYQQQPMPQPQYQQQYVQQQVYQVAPTAYGNMPMPTQANNYNEPDAHFTMPPLQQPSDAPRPEDGAFGGAPPIPTGYDTAPPARWPAAPPGAGRQF